MVELSCENEFCIYVVNRKLNKCLEKPSSDKDGDFLCPKNYAFYCASTEIFGQKAYFGNKSTFPHRNI